MADRKRSLLFAGALSVLMGLQFTGAMAGTPEQRPDAKAFKLGNFDVVALHDAEFPSPNDGKTFGVGQPTTAVADVLKAAGAPTDVITLSVDALLVKTPKNVVLIDTGIGGALQQSLKMAGYTPDEITDVLITHTHPDHVGGLVKDGKPAFPNATVRMSRAEWSFMKKNEGQAAIVKALDGKVKTFQIGSRVVPGIVSVSLPGHTPGHAGYRIVSAGQKLLDFGDTAHSSIISLAKPTWDIAFDSDHQKADRNRVKTLTRLAKSGDTIFAPHFPFPGVGTIAADGDHFKWVSANLPK